MIGASEQYVADFAQAAQAFELRARQASYVVGSYVLWWRSLARTLDSNRAALDRAASAALASGALTPADLAGLEETVRLNVLWLERARAWGAAIHALDKGTAELQPWQRPGEQIRFAIVRRDSPLGWWAVAMKVIAVLPGLIISGVGMYLADAWLTTEQTEADARKLNAQVRADLAKFAKADPKLAVAIADATGRADAAARDSSGWFETLIGGAGTGAGAGLVALAFLYLLGGKRKR